jgi:hypothetical protein
MNGRIFFIFPFPWLNWARPRGSVSIPWAQQLDGKTKSGSTFFFGGTKSHCSEGRPKFCLWRNKASATSASCFQGRPRVTRAQHKSAVLKIIEAARKEVRAGKTISLDALQKNMVWHRLTKE